MRNCRDYGSWYALFVLTGEEDNVKKRLEHRFRNSKLKFIVPKRKLMERKEGKWKEKVRTLFPGYILVNGYMGVEEYYSLTGIPGLLGVLKDTCEPLEISEQDIAVLKKLICNGEIIEHSSALLESGKVVIVDGPLLGLEGLIQSIDRRKGRARVRLNFACEPRLVDLSIFIIKAV